MRIVTVAVKIAHMLYFQQLTETEYKPVTLFPNLLR